MEIEMKRSIAVIAVLAFGCALAGCDVRFKDRDAFSQEIGSDFFGAGGMLNLTEPVAGDAFLAGGNVSVAGEIKGDLIVAGGEVSVGGNLGDDLYAAGGNVKLDAIVAGNARIAGGDIAVGPATVVAGALSLTGASIEFDGEAHDYLQASGGSVRINGVVHGDARVRAEEIDIGPETRIEGRLIVHGASQPDVPEGAVIAGGIEFHKSSPNRYFGDTGHTVRAVAHGVGTVLWFCGVFLAGALFLFVFPGLSSRAAQSVGKEPLKSIGLGFAVLVCVPVFAVMLLITVIGIPLALLLLPLYLLLLFLGWVTTALFLGEKGRALLRGANPAGTTGGRLIALFIALVALWLLGRIPVIGGWITFLALLAGIGALVWQAWSGRERAVQAAL
jgi:hypothetical protein